MNGKRSLTKLEYERVHSYLLRHKRYRDLAMISLCYHTGYRIKEVLTVTAKDIVTPHGAFREKLYIAPRKMKKKTPRMPIPMRDELKSDLLLLLNDILGEYFFCDEYLLLQSQKGGNKAISYTQAYRIVKDVFDACNIYDNVAVHSFRKSFCQDVYDRTKDIVHTQFIMGHTTPVTTLKYIRVDEEKLNQIILNN